MNKLRLVTTYLQKNKLLTVLAILFFLIRLPFLSQQFLLHDERDIVFSGYTIAKLGQDLLGNPFPLSFEGINPKTPFVSIYSVALWWIIMPIKSVFTARLFFVLITSILIFLVYEIVRHITKKNKLSIVTAIIFTFSPWIFHITSLALEVNLALTLVLAGILCFLKEKRMWMYIFFGLAFFSYQGYRILIPALVIYLEFFNYFIKHDRIYKVLQRLIKHVLFIVVIFSASFLVDGSITGNRMSELVFFDTDYLSVDVHVKRATSQAPPILQRIMHNKLSATIDHLLNTLVIGIGPDHLFKKGDPSPIYGSTAGGQFFLFFLPIMAIGIIQGFKQKIGLYIGGLILIGMLPSLVSTVNTTFAIRSSLSAVGFAFFLGLGTVAVYEHLRKFPILVKRFFFFTTIIIFVVHIAYFGYNYYFRRPITVGELFFEHERQLSQYLIEHATEIDLVYHKRPNEAYLSYYFLNTELPVDKLKADFSNSSILKTNNVAFLNCDLHKDIFFDQTKSRIVFEECLTPLQYTKFSQDPLITKIPYKDFSFKTAYFIFPKMNDKQNQ